MSDRTPRDADLDAALAHGILEDEAALDRRRFLARFGAAGVLGAAMLGFGRGAGAMASRLERLAPPPGAPRPIYMIALGDSVMWGQGLAEDQRYQTKVEKWVAANNPDRRQVKRWNFAHSGATIGSLKGLSASQGATGQMTAAAFAKLASANPRSRSYDDVPDLELVDRRDLKSGRKQASSQPTHGKPNEPTEGDRLGGEIPRSYPTLWRQLDLALETLRTGRDPRFDYGGGAPVDPAHVDLVLLTGGANDTDFLGTVLNAGRDSRATYDYVRNIVQPRMQQFLPKVMAAFPNASIVMTTYYHALSMQSSPGILAPLVQMVSATTTVAFPLPAIVGGRVAENQIGALVGRMDAFVRAIDDAYAHVVAQQPDRQRIRIVAPAFAPENGYGARRSFIWHVEETDPAHPSREAECASLLGQWIGGLVGGTTSAVDTPLWLICRDASMFHPNVAGANRYFERIRAELEANPPAFMRPSPRLRVVVEGTSAGDRKTVTVTAFDPTTGQPVDGTVRVAGVTGRTGAALTFDAACGVTAAADAPPAEIPVGTRGAVRRLPQRAAVAKAPTACSGTVTAPGYLDGTFRY